MMMKNILMFLVIIFTTVEVNSQSLHIKAQYKYYKNRVFASDSTIIVFGNSINDAIHIYPIQITPSGSIEIEKVIYGHIYPGTHSIKYQAGNGEWAHHTALYIREVSSEKQVQEFPALICLGLSTNGLHLKHFAYNSNSGKHSIYKKFEYLGIYSTSNGSIRVKQQPKADSELEKAIKRMQESSTSKRIQLKKPLTITVMGHE